MALVDERESFSARESPQPDGANNPRSAIVNGVISTVHFLKALIEFALGLKVLEA